MYKKIILYLSFSLLFIVGKAQNLVPNYSFESYSLLPNSSGQWFICNNWSSLTGVRIADWPYATPDYLHTQGLGEVKLPNCVFATVHPHTGDAIMGFIAVYPAEPNFREYMSVRLLSPLIRGEYYTLSFWITNGESNFYNGGSSNRIGIRLTTAELHQNTHEPLIHTPQLEINESVWDTAWKLYTFKFTADSAYTHIALGNFYDDASTTYTQMERSVFNGAYYFIDDIVLTKSLPPVTIKGDSSICQGSSVALKAINGSTYTWENSSNRGVVISRDSILTISPASTTTYLVYNGTDTAYFTVKVKYPPAPVNLGNDTSLCPGDILILHSTSANAISYKWQDNSTDSTFTVMQSGIYWVDVINTCETKRDSINVNYVTIPNLGKDTAICHGDTVKINVTTRNAAYSWQDNSTSPIYNITDSGTYWVKITAFNCSTIDTIHVTYKSQPDIINLGKDTVLCSGAELILDASANSGIYKWQNNSTSATFNVTQQGVFWVEVKNNCGVVSDTLVVSEKECNCSVYIPTAFSPNDDNINDAFFPIYNCDFNEYSLIIINRWSEKVFETTNPELSWNGIYKNEKAPLDSYLYLLKYKFNDNIEKFIKGIITLIR